MIKKAYPTPTCGTSPYSQILNGGLTCIVHACSFTIPTKHEDGRKVVLSMVEMTSLEIIPSYSTMTAL